MSNHVHIMLDLETLGQRAGCCILSIGACEFSVERGIGKGFYEVVNTASCKQRGLHVDPSTEQWWRGQSEDARKVLEEARTSKIGLGGALQRLSAFFKDYPRRATLVYSQGADFDLPILAHCYAVMDMPLPWDFWNSRCHRTLRAIGNLPKRMVAHSALQDATDQAHEAIKVMKMLDLLKKQQADEISKIRDGAFV